MQDGKITEEIGVHLIFFFFGKTKTIWKKVLKKKMIVD